MSTINESSQWKSLEEHAIQIKELHLKSLLEDGDRSAALVAQYKNIILDYSREKVNVSTMDMLFELAAAAGLEQKRLAMISGEKINTTEDRAVMHMALRAPSSKALFVDGVDVVPAVHAVLEKITAFSEEVRSGAWTGCTGKHLTNVVSIGIGGSYLGPEFVYEALRADPSCSLTASGRSLRFLANVDPTDAARTLAGLDPEETLVIIVSKTFTTAETMLNARTVRAWLCAKMKGRASVDEIVSKHVVAVSSAVEKAVAFGIQEQNVFGFWDWVGGRYSVCSAVGVLPLALQYGFPAVHQFLAGAHDMDTHFNEAPLRCNLPVLLGLIGLWNSSFLGHATRAILPYSQGLSRFAAHIQQVDMESNGKRVSLHGDTLPFPTGEINFGEPGTNGQHSFYQLLHQGRVVPAEFIAFCLPPAAVHLPGESVSSHDELMSNFFAQPDALACGKSISELQAEQVPLALQPHKHFPGDRPSLSLLFPGALTPHSCGQLLALYEHRVAVQGFVWGINSFDQWGVELGKALATRVRSQLAEARAAQQQQQVQQEQPVDDVAISASFNSSTSFLLKRYLHNSTVTATAGGGGDGGVNK